MITGSVRDRFPRVTLTLTSLSAVVEVEFILDTAFDGELSIPPDIAMELGLRPVGYRSMLLADGTLRRSQYYRTLVEWDDETRQTEIVLLDSNPLLGVELLKDLLIRIEMAEQGEVRLEDL